MNIAEIWKGDSRLGLFDLGKSELLGERESIPVEKTPPGQACEVPGCWEELRRLETGQFILKSRSVPTVVMLTRKWTKSDAQYSARTNLLTKEQATIWLLGNGIPLPADLIPPPLPQQSIATEPAAGQAEEGERGTPPPTAKPAQIGPPEQISPAARAIAIMMDRHKATGKIPKVKELALAVGITNRGTLYRDPQFNAARKALRTASRPPKG